MTFIVGGKIMKAIRVHKYGGAEALTYEEIPLPEPKAGEARVKIEASGLNYIDVYHRTGLYPTQTPFTLGTEAAGGVGLLLIQIAKQRGANVIGTVSTEAKAQLAKEAGADAVILYTQTDFVPEVKKITDGRGAHVVYDSVGQTTFDKSLDCLRPRGYLVLFGQSSGPVPLFNLGTLAAKGSLFLTRPTLV